MADRTANDGTEWEYFSHMAKRYNLQFRQTGITQDAVAALKAGALVICSMGRKSAAERGYFTSSGHFILAYNVDDAGNILVNDPISKIRTQAPVSIFREQCRQYFIFSKLDVKREAVKVFNDVSKVAPWAKDAVQKVEQLGIMKGDNEGNFNPKQPVTREELAVVITNLLNKKG
jgi:hypothetical protein